MIFKNYFLISLSFLLIICNHAYGEEKWRYVYYHCYCDEDGYQFASTKKKRLFISGLIYSSRRYDCTLGQFYNELNMHADRSPGFKSEKNATDHRNKTIRKFKRRNYIIRGVKLEKYPDCD